MAKLAGKKTISDEEMSQEIDAKRYLGKDADDAQVRLFAELAIEQINQRTLDGKTIHGGKFKKYSKEYAAKKGVSRSAFDLFLEGDMLDSVDYDEDAIADKKVRILINDDLDTKKGYNHHIGDTLPKRPWFGLTTDEARMLAGAVLEEIPGIEPEETTQENGATFTLAELRAALKQLGLEQIE